MDAAAKSLVVYGAYLALNAVGLVFTPNMVLNLLGAPSTSEPWIRVLGLVVGEIGFYFVFVAARGLKPFYLATVHARWVASLVFVGLVVAGLGPWQLLVFAAVDVVSAFWTRLSIKTAAQA